MSNLQRSGDGLAQRQIDVINKFKEQATEVKEFIVPEFSLDDDLAEIENMIAAEQPEPEGLEEEAVPLHEEMQRDILQLLAGREDAPSDDQILAWKEQHGEDAIQLLGLDKSNVYIYTHLTVSQWDKIQTLIQKVQGTPMAQNVERMIRDQVIRSAVLWPRLPNDLGTMRAGLPDTIYQLVLIHSYFLSPQQAMTLTTQL